MTHAKADAFGRRAYCPDISGRDLVPDDCDGGSYPREVRHGEPGSVSAVSEADEPCREFVRIVRDVPTLSDRALALIDGPRQDDYASPELNFARIGGMWAAILGLPESVTPKQVALMMAALKIARLAHKDTEDGRVDAVGYLEIFERLR